MLYIAQHGLTTPSSSLVNRVAGIPRAGAGSQEASEAAASAQPQHHGGALQTLPKVSVGGWTVGWMDTMMYCRGDGEIHVLCCVFFPLARESTLLKGVPCY